MSDSPRRPESPRDSSSPVAEGGHEGVDVELRVGDAPKHRHRSGGSGGGSTASAASAEGQEGRERRRRRKDGPPSDVSGANSMASKDSKTSSNQSGSVGSSCLRSSLTPTDQDRGAKDPMRRVTFIHTESSEGVSTASRSLAGPADASTGSAPGRAAATRGGSPSADGERTSEARWLAQEEAS